MQRWEYQTLFLQADAVREEDYLRQYRDWKEKIPDFTVEALMPRLNALGEQGWELVSLEPVFVGNRGDILAQGTWTSKYLGVFKRPRTE